MAGAYTITISAVDAATSAFDAINKRVEALNARVARAAAPFKKLGESVKTFTQVTGLARIATGFADVARAGSSAFQSLSKVIEPLAAITGAASLAGLYKLASAWGEFGQQLANQAARAGTTAESLAGLQNAARLAGVSTDALTGGVTQLNDNLRNAAVGAAPDFLRVLRVLGISYDELARKSPEERIKTLAAALGTVTNATDRALYAQMLFGGSSEALLPLLNRGAAGFAELQRRAAELGGTFTPEMQARALAFAQAQRDLGLSVEGLGRSIGNVLGPAIQPLIVYTTDTVVAMRHWIDANQDWLRGEISAKVGEFVTWLKGIDWAKVGTDIMGIATAAVHLVEAIGSLSPTAKTVLEYFGGLWLTGMLGPLFSLTKAVVLLIAAVGTSLPRAFVAATAAAELFSQKAMALPVFKAIAIAAGLFDRLGTPISVDTLPADSPLRHVGERDEPGATQETGRDDRDDSSLAAFLRRHAPGAFGYGSGAQGAVPVVPLAPGERTRNAQAIGAVFQHEGGYTREGAAALVGSGIQESGLNPRSGAGTAHQGIFQWDAERRGEIEQHFGKAVVDMTPEEQARAAVWEIAHRRAFAGLQRTLQTSHDLPQQNDGVTRTFEAPGNYDTEVPNRLGLSQGVLPALGDPASPAPAPSPVASGAQRTANVDTRRDAAPLPSTSSPPGAGGPFGRIDVGVTFRGPASDIGARVSGDVGALNIRRPGLVDEAAGRGDYSRGY